MSVTKCWREEKAANHTRKRSSRSLMMRRWATPLTLALALALALSLALALVQPYIALILTRWATWGRSTECASAP